MTITSFSFVRCSHQKEPELVHGNEELWTFVIYAGEDHTNTQTLVAFLGLLSTLVCIMVTAMFSIPLYTLIEFWTSQASTEAGAAKVYELLQGKVYRSVGWTTLFDCLSIYEEKFKKSIQSSASMLPDFPEGDAQALVAYLAVLRKVWVSSISSNLSYLPLLIMFTVNCTCTSGGWLFFMQFLYIFFWGGVGEGFCYWFY